MVIVDYETTINELKNFQDIRLNRLSQIEMSIDSITNLEVLELYEMLQQTKLHLNKLKRLIES